MITNMQFCILQSLNYRHLGRQAYICVPCLWLSTHFYSQRDDWAEFMSVVGYFPSEKDTTIGSYCVDKF